MIYNYNYYNDSVINYQDKGPSYPKPFESMGTGPKQ